MKYKEGQGIIIEEGVFLIIKNDEKFYYTMEYNVSSKHKFKKGIKMFSEEEVQRQVSEGLEKIVQKAYYNYLLKAPVHHYYNHKIDFYRELTR